MSGYSNFERNIARFLSTMPAFKKLIKSTYARLVWLGGSRKIKTRSFIDLEQFGCGSVETFFGYYDKSPVDFSGNYMLGHESEMSTRKLPDPKMPINVVVKSIHTKEEALRLKSSAYNWQQGTRAQWLEDQRIVFNDFSEEYQSYIARVCCVRTKKSSFYKRPVQDSYRSQFFVSIDYRRLMSLSPDYGYRNIVKYNKSELRERLDEDGIWRVEYGSGTESLICSIEQIVNIGYRVEFAKALHVLNHVSISPGGDSMMFIHRYYIDGRRFDRLLVAKTDGSELEVVSDYKMISHCCWLDEEKILGYMRGSDGRDGYQLINILSGVTELLELGISDYGDGHPSARGDWFITDTYPDRAQLQHLILVNWRRCETVELGVFFHGFRYSGQSRCDLHPRISADGSMVFFDSVFTGKRQLYYGRLSI